ncbi:MAG: response regulator [Syntrophobacteraceae bacterium]
MKGRLRVLVVEDDEDDFLFIRELLLGGSAFRFDLDWRKTFQSGLAQIAGAAYDAVLVDYKLDGRSGLDLIREAVESGCPAPLILLTGHEDSHVDEEAMEAGAADYLVKGQIGPDLLERSIRYAMARKRAELELKNSRSQMEVLVVERTKQLEALIAQMNLTLEKLQKSETLFRNIFENHAAVKLIIDPGSANIIDANHAAAKFYGWPRQRLRQMNIGQINVLPPQQLKREIERAMSLGRVHFEFQHRRADGSLRDVEVFSSKIEVAGRYLLHSIIHDITGKKKAQQEKEKLQAQLMQAQKMESVGRLAGGVAHDFNNMLGVILGYTDLALTEVDPAQPLFANLEQIRKAAMRSADLTRQLLAFARKQIALPKVLDLNDTVEGMLEMLRHALGEDIELVWRPARDLWQVKIDPAQLDQILANLCVNARDAIAGVGKVAIQTQNFVCRGAPPEPWLAAGEYVLLTVSDDGCGMDRETIGKLFEPFFTTRELGKGTGLGLATVYGIVKQNNGFINVYSEPHQGTTFKIYLPRHESRKAKELDGRVAKTSSVRPRTVLLVEDEAVILDMAQMMLESHGYRVLATSSPETAMRLAGESKGEIDLLITDVVMPGMNGRDLAAKLMAQVPKAKCLFMSGYTADVIARKGMLEECVNFLQKPFTIQDMVAKVRQVLDHE